MINPRRSIRQAIWILNGYLGRSTFVDTPHKVTVLLTYYHPARMNHIDFQIRNFLKCTFVEKIVITNHNPTVRIEDKFHIRDERLVCINQDVRRGNGFRWRVANTLDADYFVVIDDDVLLFPSQLKKLFQHLISEPTVPHGYAGQLHLSNDEFVYRERENGVVDYLCELYAVTKDHVKRYAEIERLISDQDQTLADFVERFADHIVISQTSPTSPKIHEINRLLRSGTFKTPGIATHKNEDFYDGVIKVSRAVRTIKLQIVSASDRSSIETSPDS